MREIHESYKYSQHLSNFTEYEEVLIQLFHSVRWDGDLLNKPIRNTAVKNGHVEHYKGWNYITAEGIEYLITVDAIRM